nr:hypothetical protein [Tanacetum cinerariifolium]
MMEIDNEQNIENKEFPSINDVFGNVSNTSSTSIKSQTYAKLLKHDSFVIKVNFHTLEAPTYDGVDITIYMSSEVEVNDSMVDLDNDVGMNSNVPLIDKVDYIVSPSTNIDVKDDNDDEDEMKILTWRRTRMTMRRVKMVDMKIIVYAGLDVGYAYILFT